MRFLFSCVCFCEWHELTVLRPRWRLKPLGAALGVLYLVWLSYNHFRAALRAQEGVLAVVSASGSKALSSVCKRVIDQHLT